MSGFFSQLSPFENFLLVSIYIFCGIVMGKIAHDRWDFEGLSIFVGLYWPIAVFFASALKLGNFINRILK